MALSNKLFLVNHDRQECVIFGWTVLEENHLGLQKLGSSLGVTV